MLTDLAEALVRSGRDVVVVCSRQLYENSRAVLPAREVIRGVTVRRIATARFGRDRLIGRALDYATFYLSAAFTLLRIVRRTDVLVAKTDPPLLSLVGAFVATCRGAPLVNWLQDVFPEVASRLALSPLPRSVEAVLRAARDKSLTAAHANVVLGTRMREYLLECGIPSQRIRISENWADETAVQPLPTSASSLRKRLGLEDRFVVAYSGNLGRAHDVDTLLNAAALLSQDPEFVFLMIGGGVNMRLLEARARERELTNFRFLPYQPRDALPDSLAAGDVHLASLLPALEGLIVPSKVYGILAAGRPVVFVGDPDGELSRVIREAGVGVSVACGDAQGLCDALRALREDKVVRERFGVRARQLLEERYTLRAAVGRWEELLNGIAADPEHSNLERNGSAGTRAAGRIE
jgi:glycosyltransferase involved in cell wall biosynthesis